jgi:hypothetical protein
MKQVIFKLILLFLPTLVVAQTYEIGGFVGGANYIGDVGKTTYISPKTGVFGGVFKWNRSNRHAFRATLLFANIEGNDADSNDKRRKERGYSFSNTLTEFSLGIEFTFFDFNVHSQRIIGTPYLYTGFTYFGYDALYKRQSTNKIVKFDNAGSLAIPMVIGYKTFISTNMLVGFEIGARYTFTDDLDGSNPVNGLKDEPALKFGNINSNDWYVFTGVTVTFAFGRKPCYCNF